MGTVVAAGPRRTRNVPSESGNYPTRWTTKLALPDLAETSRRDQAATVATPGSVISFELAAAKELAPLPEDSAVSACTAAGTAGNLGNRVSPSPPALSISLPAVAAGRALAASSAAHQAMCRQELRIQLYGKHPSRAAVGLRAMPAASLPAAVVVARTRTLLEARVLVAC